MKLRTRLMQEDFWPRVVLGICFVGPIVGYPFTAALMSLLQIENVRFPSILMRVVTVALALFFLWQQGGRLKIYRRSLAVCFVIFWAAYVARVALDTYNAQIVLPVPGDEMLIMVFMFTLLPAMPGFRALDEDDSQAAYWALVLVTSATMLLILYDSQRILIGLADDQLGRFQLNKLDPLGLSIAGGLSLLLGSVGLFSPAAHALAPSRLVAIALVGGGLLGLLLGASRGPILGALITLLMYAAFPMRLGRITAATGAGAALLFVGYLIYSMVVDNFSFDVFERVVAGIEGREESAQLHHQAYVGAIEQFLADPLFGNSVIERSTAYYPHNAVLEALIATGLLGGVPYVAILAMSLAASLRVLQRRDGNEWLALLCIYYGVLAQTGGSHFGLGAHWLTMLAVVTSDSKSRLSSSKPAGRSVQRIRSVLWRPG